MPKQPPTIFAHDGYFFTILFDKKEKGYYGEVSDIEGKDVGRTEIWATRALAKHDTIAMIENLKAEKK